MLLDVSVLSPQDLLVSLFEEPDTELDVIDQHVALAAGEILSNNDTKHLELLCVGSHGVGGDDPTTATKSPCQGEFVESAVLIRSKAEGD